MKQEPVRSPRKIGRVRHMPGTFLLMATLWPIAPAHAAEAPRAIAAPDAPAAIGPYSQAILTGDTLYLSGQIGVDPKTGDFASGDIEGQTDQALRNLSAVLAAAGMSMDDVVQAQVFLADLDDFAAMNKVYAGWFKLPPARATVQVARLPRDARVEIMLVAVRRRGGE